MQRTVSYIVRSQRAGSQTLPADVQQAVWSISPSLPLANVRTLQEIYDKPLARTSFTLVRIWKAFSWSNGRSKGIIHCRGRKGYPYEPRFLAPVYNSPSGAEHVLTFLFRPLKNGQGITAAGAAS
jgi:hypothetical protein